MGKYLSRLTDPLTLVLSFLSWDEYSHLTYICKQIKPIVIAKKYPMVVDDKIINKISSFGIKRWLSNAESFCFRPVACGISQDFDLKFAQAQICAHDVQKLCAVYILWWIDDYEEPYVHTNFLDKILKYSRINLKHLTIYGDKIIRYFLYDKMKNMNAFVNVTSLNVDFLWNETECVLFPNVTTLKCFEYHDKHSQPFDDDLSTNAYFYWNKLHSVTWIPEDYFLRYLQFKWLPSEMFLLDLEHLIYSTLIKLLNVCIFVKKVKIEFVIYNDNVSHDIKQRENHLQCDEFTVSLNSEYTHNTLSKHGISTMNWDETQCLCLSEMFDFLQKVQFWILFSYTKPMLSVCVLIGL